MMCILQMCLGPPQVEILWLYSDFWEFLAGNWENLSYVCFREQADIKFGLGKALKYIVIIKIRKPNATIWSKTLQGLSNIFVFYAANIAKLEVAHCFCSILPFILQLAGLTGSVGCAPDWWSEGCGFNPIWDGNILSWRFVLKFFLLSFSPFHWFKKGSCQFLAKECVQYWLTAWSTKPVQWTCWTWPH